MKRNETIKGEVSTVGQLREALKDVPDDVLVNIGTRKHGYTINVIGRDCMSLAIMTDETGSFPAD